MWLKIVIVLLFFLMIASLTSGLVFLLKDMGAPESKRILYALGIRIGLAIAIVICIYFGYETGLLSGRAPWTGRY